MKQIKKRILAGTLAAATLTAFTAGCSNGDNADTAETIKIGSLNHVTGIGAPWGDPMQKAIELAVEEINASGGVLGKQIELIAEDDNTDTDMALQKAKSSRWRTMCRQSSAASGPPSVLLW